MILVKLTHRQSIQLCMYTPASFTVSKVVAGTQMLFLLLMALLTCTKCQRAAPPCQEKS